MLTLVLLADVPCLGNEGCYPAVSWFVSSPRRTEPIRVYRLVKVELTALTAKGALSSNSWV